MFRSEMVGSKSARHTVNVTSLSNKVVVALKAEKGISNAGLAWALTHVVHSTDCITLLAVYCAEKNGKRFWKLPRFGRDCATGRQEMLPDRFCEISESCSQMVLQLHNQIEVRIKIKVVLGTPYGAVAAEAKSSGANWVILDKKLKQELKHCLEELHCNIVVMKGTQAKVLRLNLGCSDDPQTPFFSTASSPESEVGKFNGQRLKHSTPVNSPEEASTSYTRTSGEASSSSFDAMSSPFLVYDRNPLYELQVPLNGHCKASNVRRCLYDHQPSFETDIKEEQSIPLLTATKTSEGSTSDLFWISRDHYINNKIQGPSKHRLTESQSSTLLDQFVQSDQDIIWTNRIRANQTQITENSINSSIRSAIPLGRTSSIPPPLCSYCQNKAPAFGKPPRQFAYSELEEATDMFSDALFLAEGGFGMVHKGVLRDGQVIAVKRLKFCGYQADVEFSREVRVLSCAQHRNVVLLIGFCIEGDLRLLVYEYICNGSLEFHLHGSKTSLGWKSRYKIALGTARGVRYLHEDCRVGCIVHKDLRPNNILLTHDFEPLVADFGLARWNSDANTRTDNRIIGTSGYLAPEYVASGEISHKLDVYAFGMILLELITGQKINELQRFNKMPELLQWFGSPFILNPNQMAANFQLLDPFLETDSSHDFTHQLQAMCVAASLCLSSDPDNRPSMSKVLRVLEGGDPIRQLDLDLNSFGNRSGHLCGLAPRSQFEVRRSHSRRLSH